MSVVRELTGDHGKMMLADFTKWFNERWAALLSAESELAALRERLKPFAHAAEYLEAETSGFTDDDPLTITYRNEEDSATDIGTILSFGDFRRARTALHGREKDNG